jgi:hypothetical protein
MKKYLSIFILPFVSTMALAQAPSAVISIGSGITTTSSALKNDAQIGNGYLINTSVFVPFARKGWDGSVKGSGKFALGIIAGAAYNSSKNLSPGVGPTQNMYKLYTGDLNIINNQKGSANSTGFTGLAGLQADFTLGKITLSPSVSGAYFSLNQDGFAQSSEVMVNGTAKTVVLLASAPAKRSGFIFKPQFKVSYPIAGSLSFYAAGGLNVGPKITTTQSRLVPQGGFNDKNMYEPMQLTAGTRDNQSTVSRYQTIDVTAGVSWGFGGTSANSRHRLKGKVTKPGDNGLIYTRAGETPAESQAAADEHRTYTGGRKVETSALVAGQPIKGVIVKGGINPGGSKISVVSDNNGGIELKGLEAGDYKFTITAPEQPEERSISEKGVKRGEDGTSNRLSMTPTTTKQTQGSNFGEKVAGGLQSGAGAVSQGASKSISEQGVSSTKGRPKNMDYSPGSPIGGIVVKGGKNPGGNMMVITTNDNGEFELKGLEAGDYKFVITAPEDPAGKSISEKGVSSTKGRTKN